MPISFFVLTSKEAYESKVEQAEEKAERELKKQERLKLKQSRAADAAVKQAEKVSKKLKRLHDTVTPENEIKKKTVRTKGSKNSQGRKKSQKSKEDNWQCLVCSGRYFDKNDPHYEDDWVMCIQCDIARYHSLCAVGHGQFDTDDVAGDFTCASCYGMN